MRRVAPLVAIAGVAAFADTAAADVRFDGRTSQGTPVRVVSEDDGVPKRASIRWRADCRRPRFTSIQSTGFSRPLDLSTRRRFRDAGTYQGRPRNGFRLTYTVRISGRKVGPRRWAGRFRGRLVVRRGGRVFDRCAVRGVRWRAVRPAR